MDSGPIIANPRGNSNREIPVAKPGEISYNKKKKKEALRHEKPSGGPIRARDSEINYYAASGMLFLLGLVVSIFMTVLCFRAQRPGSSQMLLLLDGCRPC